MPCYNSEDTLFEAVMSCYNQELDSQEFEIIIVDDGSRDTTRNIIEELAKKHKEIRFLFHEKNLGGGQARNTGIRESQGKYIFCLDSDNYFAHGTLRKMLVELEKKEIDGVVIHERRFFKDKNPASYTSHFNTIKDQPFVLDDLLNGSGLLLDNFLFTREAYDKTLGYPVRHGFDTQCFEFRFLSAGNKVVTVPGAVFYHRQITKGKSYFQRVYEQGMFSINFYLIFEELLQLFSDQVIGAIIDYDIFSQNKLGRNNIKSHLENLYQEYGKDFFRKEYQSYSGKNGLTAYSEQAEDSFIDRFIKAISFYRLGKFEDARNLFLVLQKEKPDSVVIAYNIQRCLIALSGDGKDVTVEEQAAFSGDKQPRRRKMIWNSGWLHRLIFFFRKLTK